MKTIATISVMILIGASSVFANATADPDRVVKLNKKEGGAAVNPIPQKRKKAIFFWDAKVLQVYNA